MKRWLVTTAVGVSVALVGCGGSNDSSHFNSSKTSAVGGQTSGSNGSLGATIGTGTDSDGGSGSGSIVLGDGGSAITAIIRDFRFYDAGDPTTNPDFENPPYTLLPDGGPEPSGTIDYGPWDDHDIVTDTLGSDGKPVYKNASGTTLTTHGQSSFNQWYNDVPNTNYTVMYPLPLTTSNGTLSYSSQISGVTYGNGQSGKGFFPIDDGTPYATPFGDQVPANSYPPYTGTPHNFSFTVEIDTVFTYMGGETFNFQGDDDVFVYINDSLVVNLGGVHGAEPAMVSVDSLNLTKGKQYPLNFFSAERHVSGSNIIFSTTLQLMPAGPIPK